MATEYRVLVVDSSGSAPGGSELSLQSLRDAVLGHPSLALEALRHALGSAVPIEGSTTDATPHGGGLPTDTPIFKMLSPDQAQLLSPAAMKLTKADLLALQGPGNAAEKLAALNLTFDDLKTVEEAFHQRFAVQGLEEMQGSEMTTDDGVSCCCCTPCCCCTAVAVPAPLVGVA